MGAFVAQANSADHRSPGVDPLSDRCFVHLVLGAEQRHIVIQICLGKSRYVREPIGW